MRLKIIMCPLEMMSSLPFRDMRVSICSGTVAQPKLAPTTSTAAILVISPAAESHIQPSQVEERCEINADNV